MRPFIFKYTAVAAAAPTNLTLAAGVLNWTDPTPAAALTTPGNKQNEIGFRIERSANYGAFTAIGTVLANTTTFTDKTVLAPLTDYSYRVVAYNAAGDSLPSNTVTLVQQPGGLTPSVLTFAAQAIGTTSAAQAVHLVQQGNCAAVDHRLHDQRPERGRLRPDEQLSGEPGYPGCSRELLDQCDIQADCCRCIGCHDDCRNLGGSDDGSTERDRAGNIGYVDSGYAAYVRGSADRNHQHRTSGDTDQHRGSVGLNHRHLHQWR